MLRILNSVVSWGNKIFNKYGLKKAIKTQGAACIPGVPTNKSNANP
jgi:hypothetical protein